MDSDSFNLIGVDDFLANPNFNQIDGSGPVTGDTYSIAIIGSGAQLDHPDFGDDVVAPFGIRDRIVYQQNFVNPTDDASDDTADGRDTGVTHVIAEMAPGVNLIILEAFDPSQSIGAPAIEAALNWVIANRINYNIVAAQLSFNDGIRWIEPQTADNSGSALVQTIDNEPKLLHDNRVTIVAASADKYEDFSSQQGLTYPAASPWVVSVGGVWDKNEGDQTDYSDPTTKADQILTRAARDVDLLDLVAPGGFVTAATVQSGTDDYFGTTFSAAHVTAAVALAQDVNETLHGNRLSTDALEMVFKDTAQIVLDNVTHPYPPGSSPTGGEFNRLDVEAMALELSKPATAPDLYFASDWGFSETDDVTGDTSPTFTGTAPANWHAWLYADGVAVADAPVNSSGSYTLTAPERPAGMANYTVKVAANSSVAETSRSNPSPALPVAIVDSETFNPAMPSSDVRLSETAVVTWSGSGAFGLRIDWRSAPSRPATLTKTGAGTVTITQNTHVGDRVTYNNQEGKTAFNAEMGSATAPNWEVYVAASSSVDFNATQHLDSLTVASNATATVNSGTLVVRTMTLDDAGAMIVLGTSGSSIVHDSNATSVPVSVNIGGTTIAGTADGRVTLVYDTSDSTPSLRKFGAGTFKITGVSDKTVAVNFVNEEGKTEFHTNVGDTSVAGSVNWSVRVHEMPGWAASAVEFHVSQNLAALTIDAGGLAMLAASTAPNYKTLTVGALSIAENGTLDLTNNGFIIDYATTLSQNDQDTLSARIRSWITSGRGGSGLGQGTWDGWGITSSTAAAMNASNPESRSVGYGVNMSMPLGSYTTFMGQTVDQSSLFFRYTIMADLSLDGTVDDDDVTVQTAFYGTTSDGEWITGDLDYDGDVDDDDVTLLGSFYGQSI